MIIISTTIIVKSRQVTWREKRIVELWSAHNLMAISETRRSLGRLGVVRG
jgi:hypothetical protein